MKRWISEYNEIVEFFQVNHRNPSLRRLGDHDILNWLKANRKKMNAGEMRKYIQTLLELGKQYTRKNQYE